MHPHIMVEMADRPNITQNIIVTMSNNEIIIETEIPGSNKKSA